MSNVEDIRGEQFKRHMRGMRSELDWFEANGPTFEPELIRKLRKTLDQLEAAGRAGNSDRIMKLQMKSLEQMHDLETAKRRLLTKR
jgi:hypothetical protein